MSDAIKLAAQTCIDAGGLNVTLETPPCFEPPKGFPRGELLCVNSEGKHVKSYNAKKLLKWLQDVDR